MSGNIPNLTMLERPKSAEQRMRNEDQRFQGWEELETRIEGMLQEFEETWPTLLHEGMSAQDKQNLLEEINEAARAIARLKEIVHKTTKEHGVTHRVTRSANGVLLRVEERMVTRLKALLFALTKARPTTITERASSLDELLNSVRYMLDPLKAGSDDDDGM